MSLFHARVVSRLCLAVFTASASAQSIPHTPDAEAIEAGRQLGVPAADLESGDTRTVHYPVTGNTLTMFKVVLDDGRTLFRTVDEEGVEVDHSEIRRMEREARDAAPESKIESYLRDQLERSPLIPQPAWAWLHVDGAALDEFAREVIGPDTSSVSPDDAEAVEALVTDFVMDEVQGAVAPILAELERMGVEVVSASTTSPLVQLRLTEAQALTAAAMPQLDTLYADVQVGPLNEVARITHRTTVPWSFNEYGSNRRIAIFEDGAIDPSCPYLFVQNWRDRNHSNRANHVHGVAGCVGSWLSDRYGSSPFGLLYSANSGSYSGSDLLRAADWIITQNIDITNMSWGGNTNSETYWDRLFDFQSRYYTDSYVAAAGNTAGISSTPGHAWNVVGVGAFDTRGTISWNDDQMASFSSYVDPSSGCEKPNVAASGVCVKTLGNAGNNWRTNCYSGTSFAAPFTTANMALMMNRDVSTLYSPEAAMAGIMATAWHNIEGSSRLSEKDGAGGIHGGAAFHAATKNQMSYLYLYPSSFSNNGYYTTSVYLRANDRARICIAWSANATSNYSDTELDADLDLAIYRGYNVTSGQRMGSSSSYNNNFEMVEFTPPSSGWYTLRVNDFRFDGSSERMGFAWSQLAADGGF